MTEGADYPFDVKENSFGGVVVDPSVAAGYHSQTERSEQGLTIPWLRSSNLSGRTIQVIEHRYLKGHPEIDSGWPFSVWWLFWWLLCGSSGGGRLVAVQAMGTATMRSEASAVACGRRWAYRATMEMVLWPDNSWICFSWTPANANQEQKVCRFECQV